MDATDSATQSSLSEQLRKLGLDCAAMIATDPQSWTSETTWLRTLPMCWAIVERHHGVDTTDEGEPCLIVGLDELPAKTDESAAHQFYVYDNEAETNRIQGPILRRLMTGWNAATYRFLHQQRGQDRYFDFSLADARRIVLLAAFTFNRDFDGSVVGLDFPWGHSADCGASFEGRGWAWASLTSGLLAEPTLAEVIRTATDYLRRMTPTVAPDSGIGQTIEKTVEAIIARDDDRKPARKPKPTRYERRMKWLAEAMLIVHDHPEWSDAKIAALVGINKSRLSRSPEYQTAARMARTPKTPGGSVTIKDGDRSVDAVDDSFDPNRPASRQWQDEEDTDDRIDREIKERNAKRNGPR